MLVNHGILVIAETIWFLYVYSFLSSHAFNCWTYVIVALNAHIPYICTFNAWLLNLILMRLWCLFTERRSVAISCSVPHITLYQNRTFVTISYKFSTWNNLYYHYLYGVCGVEIMEYIVGRSVFHYHHVCVPIRD